MEIFFSIPMKHSVVSVNGTFRTFSEAQDKFIMIKESSSLGYSFQNIFVKYIHKK